MKDDDVICIGCEFFLMEGLLVGIFLGVVVYVVLELVKFFENEGK